MQTAGVARGGMSVRLSHSGIVSKRRDWDGYELAILAIFRPINRRISETVQDRTNVPIDH